METRDVIQAVQLGLNLLLLPLIGYLFKIEQRLTRIEVTLEHIPRRREDDGE